MKMRKKRYSWIVKLEMAALCGLFLIVGVTFAKYMKEVEYEQLAVAKNIYFTSDYLAPAKENGSFEFYMLQEGIKTIEFELRNYEDDLRSSEVDLDYKVYLNGSEIVDKSGSIRTDESYNTITLTGLTAGDYTVVAEVIKPYSKTIGAQFRLVNTEPNVEFETYGNVKSPLIQLRVATNDYSGDIKITWGEGVYPDKTDPLLEDAVVTGNNRTHVVTELTSNSEYIFQFFKSDLNHDLKNTITVVEVND